MRKAIILAAFFCAACSNYSANLPSIKPYKMDIQQGNAVTSKMMMQLRPGMTKSQVRFVMGTPLIADSFHADRWDYLYRMAKGGKIIEQRHVILDFENDQLKRVRGDVIPAGTGEAAASAGVEGAKPAVAPKQKEKGLIDKLKFWKDDEEAVPAKVEPQPARISEPKPAPAKAPEPQPAREEIKPAAKAAPAAEPEAAQPVEENKQPAAAEPKVVEQPPQEPVKQSGPVSKPVEAQPAKSEPAQVEPAKVEPAKVEPRKATIPADDLPPEDDPGYFERMLEKIGF
jgi:outer membrane protein assembly factor BamE